MLKYRCRILFTIRSGYENQISLEVRERSLDRLSDLMKQEKRLVIWKQCLHQCGEPVGCRIENAQK